MRAYFPFQFGAALGLGKHPPCQIDEYIHEGDRIGPLHVVHAPGHTPGHLAFYWPAKRVLFVATPSLRGHGLKQAGRPFA
jgi:glyoxylase-like metal-dependent hydrolase (beta-lactamase superfamily II)